MNDALGRAARHPRFGQAVRGDAEIALRYRSEGHALAPGLRGLVQIARLCWVSDAFLAQLLYRAKARGQALRLPLLPRVAHRLALLLAQLSIGDPVIMAPGVYIPHGQVVVDGLVEIASEVVLSPFVTVGLRAGNFNGPTIGGAAQLGTGAKVLGPVTVGARAVIGANAVVVDDVAPGTTVAGAPARPL